MNPRDPKFLELQKKWYDKLKKSGFEDAEASEGIFKEYHNHKIKKQYTAQEFKDKQDYYITSGKFYYDYNFPNTTLKTIWDKHKEGVSVRDISKSLELSGIKMSKSEVSNNIHDLQKEMMKLYADKEE